MVDGDESSVTVDDGGVFFLSSFSCLLHPYFPPTLHIYVSSSRRSTDALTLEFHLHGNVPFSFVSTVQHQQHPFISFASF